MLDTHVTHWRVERSVAAMQILVLGAIAVAIAPPALTGSVRNDELSGAFGTSNHQYNSTYERESTQDWRQRNRVILGLVRVNGPDVQDSLIGLIIYALIGE